jgi:hypothetical protein
MRFGLSLLSSCVAFASLGHAQTFQQSSKVPGFQVKVTLSPKAAEELARRQETIVVFGYLFGLPKAGVPADMGEIGLGNFKTEIKLGDTARFPEFELNASALGQTTGTPQVLVNVVSGRRSSPNNLLNCSIYEGDLSKLQKEELLITCKLITEQNKE